MCDKAIYTPHIWTAGSKICVALKAKKALSPTCFVLFLYACSIFVSDLLCQSHQRTFSRWGSLLELIVGLYFGFSLCHKMMVFYQMRSREESCLKSCCNIACCSASFCCLGRTQKQCRSKSNLMCKQSISQARARDLIFLNFIQPAIAWRYFHIIMQLVCSIGSLKFNVFQAGLSNLGFTAKKKEKKNSCNCQVVTKPVKVCPVKKCPRESSFKLIH